MKENATKEQLEAVEDLNAMSELHFDAVCRKYGRVDEFAHALGAGEDMNELLIPTSTPARELVLIDSGYESLPLSARMESIIEHINAGDVQRSNPGLVKKGGKP